VAEQSGTELHLQFDQRGVRGSTVLVLRVRGEVDMLTAGPLGGAVCQGLEELARQEREDAVVQTKALLIDLREVAFIGASGLNTLITIAREVAPPRRRPPRRADPALRRRLD
jgi:anti-anti-sigma regulatory factor